LEFYEIVSWTLRQIPLSFMGFCIRVHSFFFHFDNPNENHFKPNLNQNEISWQRTIQIENFIKNIYVKYSNKLKVWLNIPHLLALQTIINNDGLKAES
jgi:hypothetical protein